MPRFGAVSKRRLETCDIRLQKVMNEAIQLFDFSILCGHRTKEEQDEAYQTGHSELQWPHGKHNAYPSQAIDIAPYPRLDWNDRERFCLYAGGILVIGHELGIVLRWGGDWDRDWEVNDNKFDDLGHFELTGEE